MNRSQFFWLCVWKGKKCATLGSFNSSLKPTEMPWRYNFCMEYIALPAYLNSGCRRAKLKDEKGSFSITSNCPVHHAARNHPSKQNKPSKGIQKVPSSKYPSHLSHETHHLTLPLPSTQSSEPTPPFCYSTFQSSPPSPSPQPSNSALWTPSKLSSPKHPSPP